MRKFETNLSSLQEKYHQHIRRSIHDEDKKKDRKKLQHNLHQCLLKNHLNNLNQQTMNQLIIILKGWESDGLVVDHFGADQIFQFIHKLQEIPFEFITLLFSRINQQSQKVLLVSGLDQLTKFHEVKELIAHPARLNSVLGFIGKIKNPKKQMLSDFCTSNLFEIVFKEGLWEYVGVNLLIAFKNLVKNKKTISTEDAFFESFLNTLKYLVSNIHNDQNIELTCEVILCIIGLEKVEIFHTLRELELIDTCLSKFMNICQTQLSLLNKVIMGLFTVYLFHTKMDKEGKQYLQFIYCNRIISYHISIINNQHITSNIKYSIYKSLSNALRNESFRSTLTSYPILGWIAERTKSQSTGEKKCFEKVLECLQKLCARVDKNESQFVEIMVENRVLEELLSVSFNERYNQMVIMLCLKVIADLIEGQIMLKRFKSIPHCESYLETIGKQHTGQEIQCILDTIQRTLDYKPTISPQ